ncbi:MAG: helix-turn-helix domain-containing protein [Synergistaceae bacterium]|nr:helix-turn-helix domain-containing protein [Synergistaceae bacterium]
MTNADFEERYLSVREVAARFGVCRDLIYRWIRDGVFPRGRHFGRLHRWALSEVMEWEAAQEPRKIESPRWANRTATISGQVMEA